MALSGEDAQLILSVIDGRAPGFVSGNPAALAAARRSVRSAIRLAAARAVRRVSPQPRPIPRPLPMPASVSVPIDAVPPLTPLKRLTIHALPAPPDGRSSTAPISDFDRVRQAA
jgi:hypothetical protein